MTWLCLVSAVVTARHIFLEAKFPSLFTWFAVAYISLFLVYPIVAPLLSIEIPTSNEVFAHYCFLAVGGLHLFIIGYECTSPPHPKRGWDVRYRATSGWLFNIICLLFILNVFAALFVLADVGSFSTIALQTRDEMKFSICILSTVGTVGNYLFMIGVLLYPLLAIHIRRQRIRVVV